ncbi:MAG: hypothetical protein HW419_1773 [Deltaproteobacteria bacterium]|nr:hypothetical protein [Deltaproteobacteria bacterium]
MRENTLGIPFISSLIIHGLMIALISATVHNSHLRRQDFLPISLVKLSKTEPAPPLPTKPKHPQEAKPVVKNETAQIHKPTSVSLASVKEKTGKDDRNENRCSYEDGIRRKLRFERPPGRRRKETDRTSPPNLLSSIASVCSAEFLPN